MQDVSSDVYRAGIGIFLLNPQGEVFVGTRRDCLGWQMPQGGIEPQETPKQALYRELLEETGLQKVEILAESMRWLYYDLPDHVRRRWFDGRYCGQKQKWFAVRFAGDESEIDLGENGEFCSWRWVSCRCLHALAVDFKRNLYRNVVAEFARFCSSDPPSQALPLCTRTSSV